MARQKEMASTGIKVRKSANDKVFDFFLYLLAAIIIIIVLYPMYFIVIASISNPADVSAGNIVLLPKGINFKGYMKLGEYTQLWVGYTIYIIRDSAFPGGKYSGRVCAFQKGIVRKEAVYNLLPDPHVLYRRPDTYLSGSKGFQPA